MALTLDTNRIRRSTHNQLSEYYKELNHKTNNHVSQQLLQAIERGSIAPQTYQTWLGVTESTHAIDLGLQQSFSVIVRRQSIKHLSKALRSARWKDTWGGLGGTRGLLDMFRDLSVNDVKETCKELRSVGKGEDLQEKRACITELFKGLQPSVFLDAPFKSTDERPLARHYHNLIPSCTEDIVLRYLNGDLQGHLKPTMDKHLMQYHPNLVQTEETRALKVRKVNCINRNRERIRSLVTQYPHTTGAGVPGFSASMDFALTILRASVEESATDLDAIFFVNELVRPLLRRAIKKNVGWSRIHEIVDLAMQYLQKHPQAGKEVTTTEGDILHLVACCWSRKPDMFEHALDTLCSHPIFGRKDCDKLTDWEDFFKDIPHDRRYALLRLCFKGATGLDIDVEADLKNVKGSISDDLLNPLESHEAISLFTRLRTARGSDSYAESNGEAVVHDELLIIRRGNTISNTAPTFGGSELDPDLYHVLLLSRNADLAAAKDLATPHIEERKNKAQHASAPEQRGFYAESAVFYAAASGDIALYQSVMMWTKRFLNDPLVARKLYGGDHRKEVIEILSGVPAKLQAYTANDVRERVRAGNMALRDIFDMACAATRARSFSTGSWNGTHNLFRRVIQQRIDHSKRLSNTLRLSDDEVYTILWDDTIEMLLDVERKANLDENEALHMNLVRGPMAHGSNSYQDYTIQLKKSRTSTFRFLDTLAKSRDELWRDLRPTVFPAVLTLPKPFPRGLPIQHLTAPWVIDVQDLEKLAPYMASRAKAVLFMDPAEAMLAMPDDKESTAAIGTFVDSFPYALGLYIPKSCKGEERERRLEKLKDYTVGPLSQSRMSQEEALRFWRSCNVLPRTEPPPRKGERLVVPESTSFAIPEVEDPSVPYEWDTINGEEALLPKRDLDTRTYLDVSLAVSDKSGRPTTLRSDICPVPTPIVPMGSPRSHYQTGEGDVLSALLFLETKHGASNGRLLEKPFPSADDTRYPSLYLDPEAHEDRVSGGFAQNFRGHINSFPPALLHRTARNMINALDASDMLDVNKSGPIERETFQLLMRLGESDRPALAMELVRSVVIDRPDAGSWHRSLLSPRFLNRLGAEDAKEFYTSFSDAILEKMGRKYEDRKPDADVEMTDSADTPAPSSRGFVKITTIKLLAQLLQKSQFIDDASAFSVLSKLLEKATHVDVRLHTAKTLLGMLDSRSAAMGEDILKALESIIPLAGNLDERKPLTEDDWITAEHTNSPPEYPLAVDDVPLLEVLVEHYKKDSEDAERTKAFIKRILVPTLDSLKQQTARWTAIFLAKHNMHNVDAPAIPRRATNFTALLYSPNVQYLPHTVLEDIVAYISFCAAPPPSPPARALAEPDAKTWIDLYRPGANAMYMLDVFPLFDTPIDPVFLRSLCMRLFDTMVRTDAPLYINLYSHLLGRVVRGRYIAKPWWATHGVPLVRDMIAHVDALRTHEWEQDPSREPTVLPDTFSWRLLVLDFPVPVENETDEASEAKCKNFAGQIGKVIEGLGRVYHADLEKLKTYVTICPVNDSDVSSTAKKMGGWTLHQTNKRPLYHAMQRNHLITAVHLGTGTPTDVLSIEVAAHLLATASWDEVDDAVKRRVRVLVEAWGKDEREDVRRIGARFVVGFGSGYVDGFGLGSVVRREDT